MVIKTEETTWIPQLPDSPELGWLRLNDETWNITKIYSFDDYGVTMETFTIEKDGETREIYSYDEGETFTFDCW